MARPNRFSLPGATYHVMFRGNNKQPIFFSNEDYSRFCNLMEDGLKQFDHSILAFCLIGKFVEITNEIFERVVSSGLYDKCDSISIGVLGDSDKLSELNNAISKFPKIKIVRHSENKGLFELFTIEELRNDCHNLDKFYAMYLHSKGVTSQNEADAKYRDDWRREMLSSVVDKYADCIEALNDGYDICGCRLVTARLSVSELTHASGNFWFANSQYIKTLPEIRTNQNSENPYPGAMYAEMWPFSGQPIIFCIDKMKYLRP